MSFESKCASFLFIFYGFFFASTGNAHSQFEEFFSDHSAVMLLIDPESGKIVDANEAAGLFYGYPVTSLKEMSIQQINTLTPEQVARERKLAQDEGRDYFIFKHQLASEEIRTVEVRSSPLQEANKTLLFSIITDISENRSRDKGLWHYQERLEELVAQQTTELEGKSNLIIFTMGISIAILLLLLAMLAVVNKRSNASRRIAEEQEATLNTIFDNITDAIIYTNQDRQIITANKSAKQIFGYSDYEFEGTSTAILYHRYSDYVEQGLSRFTPNANPRTDLYEITYQRKNGETFIGETMGSVIKNPAGDALGFIGVIRDITRRKTIEEDLRRAASVFSNASEGIIITSPNGIIIDVNDAYTDITGFTRDETIGKTPQVMKSGFHDKDFFDKMWKRLLTNGHWEGEIYNKHKNGHTYVEQLSINAVVDDQGETQSYIGLFYDITSQKEHEKQLHHIAHYDALTELPNRLLFADRLQQGIHHADRNHHYLAIVYIDLDGFKEINDKFGHEVGDKLLVTVASRMKKELRESDTIARFGGDEFVAVFADLPTKEACIPLLERVLESIAAEIKVNDIVLHITASLGVVFYPAEESEPDKLLRQADQAMYQAKLQNKNCYHIYNPLHDRSLQGRHERIERMQQALVKDEFELYYQPKVNMCTGELIGLEALIRWQHPDKGLLLPGNFLPDIANHEFDVELGSWVIASALRQICLWQKNGLDVDVSINISAQQLQGDFFVEELQTLISKYPKVDPSRLEIEILESSALEDLHKVSQIIQDCSQLGIRFSLDDFGTGYSSLTYLRTLPVETLKIDRSFVSGMLTNPQDMAIIKGVIGLAEAFNRQLVAEGVESPEQGKALIELGCEIAQGYCISRPMPVDDVVSWVDSWKPYSEWL